MNKRLLIIIPVAILIGLISSLLFLNNHQTPAWRAKLEQYLAYLRTTGQAVYHVVDYASASQPINFTPEMSAGSFSDSLVFQTDTNPNAQYAVGLEPISYPPREVVCVLLGNNAHLQLVFVTLHSSLYNADWIVHISADPWNSSAAQSVLSSLGCTLSN